METNLTQWLNREQEWAKTRNKEGIKRLIRWVVGTPLIIFGVFYGLAFFIGSLTPEAVLGSSPYLLIFAGGLDFLITAIMLPNLPGRIHMKNLKKLLNRGFSSDTEREDLAAQMLDVHNSDIAAQITWKEKGFGEQRIWITKDYILNTLQGGNVGIVFLNQTEKIETDKEEYSYKAGSVRMYETYFTIRFLYKEIPSLSDSVRKYRGKAAEITYPTRELRDKVVEEISRLHPAE